MSFNQIKLVAIAIFLVPMLAVITSRSGAASVAPFSPDDAATTYKAKCAMCHTATVSKFFDAAKSDDELVQIILKGKKGDKPPFMPAFEEKGITADQAKELVTYMKQIKAGQ
jgi:mono/diheme cytochrome c family protein